MSKTYKAALEASRKAARVFMNAQDAYRARTIGDAEFLAAKAEYKKSEAAFDAAFTAEATA